MQKKSVIKVNNYHPDFHIMFRARPTTFAYFLLILNVKCFSIILLAISYAKATHIPYANKFISNLCYLFIINSEMSLPTSNDFIWFCTVLTIFSSTFTIPSIYEAINYWLIACDFVIVLDSVVKNLFQSKFKLRKTQLLLTLVPLSCSMKWM